MPQYEAVIGLETHIQLNTNSKIFCSCAADSWEQSPNSNICPVCTGLPGVLPAPNKAAVEKAVLLAAAMHAEVQPLSYFDRKNYFYPDLPKGYQISQYDRPVAEHGFIDIFVDETHKRIGVTRAHLEDDAGKSIHDGYRDSDLYTYVDLNRTGTPQRLKSIKRRPFSWMVFPASSSTCSLAMFTRRV